MKKITSVISFFPTSALTTVSTVHCLSNSDVTGWVGRLFAGVSAAPLRRGLCAVLVAFAAMSFSSQALSEDTVPIEPAILNINTADAETIASLLNGIGEIRAQAIVSYRLKHGNFLHIDELQDVPGIGEVTFERIKSKLSITSPTLSEKRDGAATAQLAAPGD